MAEGNTGRRAAVAALVALGLLISGCTSSDGDEGAAPGTTVVDKVADHDPNGVVRTAYDLVAPQRGGVHLDPVEGRAPGDEGLYYLIYGRLLRPTQDGELVPDLAESATIVDDDTIEVVLREGITWQDGAPFDATSVKAGLDHTVAGNNTSAMSAQFFALESVEVASPITVRLTIPGSARSWYDFLGGWETTIVRPDDDFDQPVGAGPMQLTDWVDGASMALEKWDGYWDADSILVGGVELTQLDSGANESAVAAIKAGQIDLTGSALEQLPALTGNAAEYLRPDPGRMTFMQICKRDTPLSDARLRMAVQKAIDRDALNEAVFAGTGEPALGLWPEGHRYYNPDVVDDYEHDPEAVRELLAEAGSPDGFEFEAYVLQAASMPAAAEVIQAQLAEFGIEMTINAAPNYVDDFLGPGKPGMGLVPAMTQNKMNQFTGDVLSNACDYDDPEITRLADEATRVSASSDEAVQIWNQVDEIVGEDALAILILFGSNVAAYNTETLSEVALWPVGQIVVPDVRVTAVRPG